LKGLRMGVSLMCLVLRTALMMTASIKSRVLSEYHKATQRFTYVRKNTTLLC
jgi:hypothetical protein